MARKKRTEEELRDALEATDYDFDMLQGTCINLAQKKIEDKCIKNALLESFIMHARSLRDFFYVDSPRHDDDVIAQDFLKHTPVLWKDVRPKEPAILENFNDRAAKLALHLSYKRQEFLKESEEWHTFGTYKALETIYNEFNQLEARDLGASRRKKDKEIYNILRHRTLLFYRLCGHIRRSKE